MAMVVEADVPPFVPNSRSFENLAQELAVVFSSAPLKPPPMQQRSKKKSSKELSLRALYNKVSALDRQISLKWSAKAEVKWLGEGDNNTADFHKVVTARRRSNRILSLVDHFDFTVTNVDDMLNIFASHYSSLWSQPSPPSSSIGWPSFISLSSSISSDLIFLFTASEV
ncbi:hypothetical protein Cni_G16113 [Canna indica]|uniref:Uncharacterized protein n=1 Tax=Canna indica TaxID=4628 RepID=A0AAQ3KFQ8_9LILI|nr:hypothetical protein Cni_G16113 [Canna indica]